MPRIKTTEVNYNLYILDLGKVKNVSVTFLFKKYKI